MVYQSAFLRRSKNGKAWYGVLKYREGEQWRTRTRKLSAPGKREARRELAAWRAEMERGTTVPEPSTVPLRDYAESVIASKEHALAIMSVTAKDYRTSMNGWAAIADVPLSELTPEAIETALADMIAGGLSPNTAIKRYIALKMVLDHAMSRGHLIASPMSGVPRPARVEPVKNPLDAATVERVRGLLDGMPSRSWTVAARLCLLAGLRAEETSGLQLADIDLENRTGYVRRAISYGSGGAQIAPPKSKQRRDFPISQALYDVLEPWIRQHVALYGDGPSVWLLGTADRFADARDMGRRWSAFCDVCGIEGAAGRKPTLHDLRHTFATACVRGGMDVKTLQSILGHASASMTLDVYASADPAAKASSAAIIDSVL